MRNWTLNTLVLLVVVSAFTIVVIKHFNRMAFIESQELLAEKDELLIEWRQLQLGFDALGGYGRVETIVSRDLDMILPPKEQIKVVLYD